MSDANTPLTPELDSPRSGQAVMRPRSRLIALLGDELISDESVAVVELVKNAYDADATIVNVTFAGDDPSRPSELVISDDGSGMDLHTVLTGWFEPGTVFKKTSARTPGGRSYQGAKGIGRFASARLAQSLYLETKREGAADGLTVLIDWGRFDDDASYLDQVVMDYEVRPLPDLARGTRLSLIGLWEKKAWGESDFRSLHDRLSRLLSPFGDVRDFRVNLLIPGFPALSGVVEPHEVTQKPGYRLEGNVDERGHFTGWIQVGEETVQEYTDHSLGVKSEAAGCGPFSIELRVWDRDRKGLTPLMVKYHIGLRELRNILDSYCGVSVYRDGFRVHPYGEPGDDWLQLDNRSRQTPTTRLANNQVIAAIRLTRGGNPDLKDRTTREGLVHNAAYSTLKNWVLEVLALLEAERYRHRPRKEKTPDEGANLFEAFDLSTVVEEADRQLGKRHPITKLVKQSDSDIREGVNRLQEQYSRLLMTAGLGQIIDLVIHEMGAPLGRANRELINLEKLVTGMAHGSSAEKIEGAFVSVRSALEQLVLLRERLDPRAAGRRMRSTTFDVEEEIQGNLTLFESLIAKQELRVSVHAPRKDPLMVHMPRSALGQVFANLLDNSIYWLTRHHGDGKGGRIDIRLNRTREGFKMVFCDDGPGVAKQDRERIFDPYFSTKPNGMGLGLYIGRQVMERFGRLIYRDDCGLTGACFEATFERNIALEETGREGRS